MMKGKFSKISFFENHDQSIQAVLNGVVEVAPVSSINLEEMVKKNGTIEKLAFVLYS